MTIEDRCREDSEHIESLAELPQFPEVLDTEQGREVYTNGCCWYLAWWLHQLSGTTVSVVGYYDGDILDELDPDGDDPWYTGLGWNHVGVKAGEAFVDFDGLNDVYEVMERYLDGEAGEDHGTYHLETREDFNAVAFDPDLMSEKAAQITRTVAGQILRRAGIPITPSR